MRPKINAEVKCELDKTGLPYEIEQGKRHLKIKVAGRLVGILPRDGKTSGGDQRSMKNLVSQIRRARSNPKSTK